MTPTERQNEQLARLLEDAKHKLELYRVSHSGEYVGGREFEGLMREIREALSAYAASKSSESGEMDVQDRIEFALRDAGFELDSAYEFARRACAQPPAGDCVTVPMASKAVEMLIAAGHLDRNKFHDAMEIARGLMQPPVVAGDVVLSENQKWNLAGREPYKFHPQASHVSPDWRDGWNAALDCVAKYAAASPAAQKGNAQPNRKNVDFRELRGILKDTQPECEQTAAPPAPQAWRTIDSAPKSKPVIVLHEGRARQSVWGKVSHVPIYGWLDLFANVENVSTLEPQPTLWHEMPAPPAATQAETPTADPTP